MACTQKVYNSVMSPDGQLLTITELKDVIRLTDVRTGKIRTSLKKYFSKSSRTVDCVTFSPATSASQLLATTGASQLVAVGFCNGVIYVWDYSDGARVMSLTVHFDSVRSIAFSPDGRLLVSASADGFVHVWLISKMSVGPRMLSEHRYAVYGVSFSCDGSLLASCSHDKTVRLWHIFDTSDSVVTAGQVLQVGEPVLCVAFSPVDSRLLACGGSEGFLALARVGTDAIAVERQLQQGHTDAVRKLAFSPCGQTLVSASWDKTVRLWSVSSGACLRVLRGHTDCVNSVAFFPNGKRLVSGSKDETIRIWAVCAWSDRTHHLFDAQLRRKIFQLMCVRAQLMLDWDVNIPIELWLMVFEWLALNDF